MDDARHERKETRRKRKRRKEKTAVRSGATARGSQRQRELVGKLAAAGRGSPLVVF